MLPALVDIIAGNIQVIFSTLTPAAPHIKNGRIKALAVTSLKRSELVPELPTVSESGLKGFEVTGWYGVLAPAQTPRALINRLNAETLKALQSPDVKQSLVSQGFEISPSSPEEFTAFIKAELA